MVERTPLAVLASALSDQGASAAGDAYAQSADWAALKKRKRTVACGRCDACCRDDCGACLNCLDKPKFGGSGAHPFRPMRRAPNSFISGTALNRSAAGQGSIRQAWQRGPRARLRAGGGWARSAWLMRGLPPRCAARAAFPCPAPPSAAFGLPAQLPEPPMASHAALRLAL